MLRYILKRFILLLIALVVITTMTFFLLRLMPGKPIALVDQTKNMTAEQTEALYRSYGLFDGPFTAFWNYIKGIFHGNWGIDYKYNASPSSIFFRGLKVSMFVTVPAFVLGSVFGIIFGFISGYKRGKWQDVLINVAVVTFVAVPSFVLAIAFILLGDKIGLPISFNDSLGIRYLIISLILPIAVLTLGSFAVLTYYIRNEVVEVLNSDYVLIARAKGASETRILFKHVMRNVSIPMVSIIIPSFVGILAGSLIIEQFFSVPGASSMIVQGVQGRELYIVMFSVIFFSFLSLSSRLLIDVLYVVLDPRIKIASGKKPQYIKMMKAYYSRKKNKKRKAGVKYG